jgi:hypothetical protein
MSGRGEIGRFEKPLTVAAPAGEGANMLGGLPMIEMPDDGRTGGDFSGELGKHLGGAEIFRRGKILMTLTAKRDRLEPVGDHEFRTLVEKYVCLFKARVPKKTGEQILRVRMTLPLDTARLVMNSPQFLAEIREIEHLDSIPLPVRRASGKIEMLPAGYDGASRTFTLNPCDYAGLACEDGAKFLRELLAEFCFTEPERSLSVAISAMVTLFARRLLPTLAHRPAFIYTANAAGGGKTLLADCAIAPIFGSSPRTPFPRREEELEKLLLAEIMCASECLLFDNLKGRVDSPSVENLLTSHVFRGRILNQSKTYEGENHLVMFFTGNGVKISEDLARRALFAELFQPEARSQDRQFKRQLSVGWLVEHRAEVLAALWQLVRAWDAAGRPKGSRTHASFPEWAAILPALTAVGVGGYFLNRFFVKKANLAALVERACDCLDELRQDCAEYWSVDFNAAKEAEFYVIEAKIKSHVLHVSSIVTHIYEKQGRIGVDLNECAVQLSDHCTGGTFETRDRKADRVRYMRIAGCINKTCSALQRLKL